MLGSFFDRLYQNKYHIRKTSFHIFRFLYTEFIGQETYQFRSNNSRKRGGM